MQRFLSFLQSKAVLDGKFIEMVTSSVEELTLYKLDYLYTENQSINNIYFLLDGFVSSSERIEGRDILTNFWEPMTFIVPDSIVRRTYFESTGKIQLQEDSSLIKIRTSDILKSLRHPSGQYLYNFFINAELQRRHFQTRFLRLCTVKERIRYLSDRHPVVFRYLSHEQLASFVGTSRPNLTNLLSEITRGG